MNDISTSSVVINISNLKKLATEYRDNAIEVWKVDAPKGLRDWAVRRSKDLRWLGLGNLFTANPNPETILADMMANREHWMVDADIQCRRRLAQANFFLRICEEFKYVPSMNIHLSLEDFNMMKNNEYGHYGRWNWRTYEIPK